MKVLTASVVGSHAFAVGVEDAGDADVEAVGAVVGHGDGFAEAFGFVVAGAGTDAADVAEVGLGLGVDEWVAVDLAGGGEEEAGVLGDGEVEEVAGAGGSDGEDLEWHRGEVEW